jgi:Trypsin-co-occurring domain 2
MTIRLAGSIHQRGDEPDGGRKARHGQELQFDVSPIDVELTVEVQKEAESGGGLRIHVVEATADGESAGAAKQAEPRWYAPTPLGRGKAIEGMAGIAAPLLAGFSITLIGVIAGDPSHFRWPGAALAMLVITSSLLIGTVQCGFRARQFLYSAGDWRDWRPDLYGPHRDSLAGQQEEEYLQWQSWERRAGWAYNIAICSLAVSLALTVAPATGNSEAGLRWAAFAAALLAAYIEYVWIIIDNTSEK